MSWLIWGKLRSQSVPTRTPCRLVLEWLEDRTLLSTVALESYLQSPLTFEVNRGQVDEQVQFLSRGQGYNLFLTGQEAVLNLFSDTTSTVLRTRFLGAEGSSSSRGLNRLPGKSNYLLGSAPSGWQANVPVYARVQYDDVYPGIDVVYYGTDQRQLEYDFVVAPGADPGQIRLGIEGAQSIELDAQGNLILHTGSGPVVQHAPVVYQDVGGTRSVIAGSFVLGSDNQVTFALGDYDPSLPLIIDPVLVYSTYLGGSGNDDALDVTTDSAGNVYVMGYTQSATFPATTGDTVLDGSSDVFVTKWNPTGTTLLYSTFIGGTDRESDDAGFIGGHGGIAVDAAGSAYIAGYTRSANFPIVGGYDNSLDGTQDAFVAKLNAGGTALTYSTFLGGSDIDVASGIVVDGAGSAYVTGWTQSANYPTTGGILQSSNAGGVDAFVTRLNAAGSNLLFSTYLGGTGDDHGLDLGLTTGANVYVTGHTESADFYASGFLDTTLSGNSDAFVTKLNAAASSIIYSTYLGGSGDENEEVDQGTLVGGLAVDSGDNVYLVGSTSSINFPLSVVFDSTLGGTWDGYLTKFDGSGVLVYSTYVGGADNDFATDVVVNPITQVASLTGFTHSFNFPLKNALFSSLTGSGSTADAFVTQFSASGSTLRFSSYLGGQAAGGNDFARAIALDSLANVYVAGTSSSTDFPVASALFPTQSGLHDAFLSKIAIPGVELSRTTVTLAEGGVTDTYTVVLDSQPTAAVTITLSPDAQQTLSAATLVFNSGNWTIPQTVTVTAFNDGAVEGSHTGVIAATATSGDPLYNGIAVASVTATITDNDAVGIGLSQTTLAVTEGGASATYTIVLQSTPSSNVVFNLATGGQLSLSQSLLTFTPGTWNVAQTITVTAVDDNVIELSHSATITTSVSSGDGNYNNRAVPQVTAAITDDDIAGINNSVLSVILTEGNSTTFTMMLTAQPLTNVVITFTTGGQVTAVPASVTFTTANWNILQTVTMGVTNDGVISGAHTGTLSAAVASGDPFYNGLPFPSVAVNIVDPDVVNIVNSKLSVNIAEVGVTDTYTIVLRSKPSADVVVSLSTADGQETVSPGVVTFNPALWNVPQTITVSAVDDLATEGLLHTGLITATASSGDASYNLFGIAGVTTSITDNDIPHVTVSKASVGVLEGGGTDTYTLVLDTAPAANVVITLNVAGQVLLAPSPLTFTSGNWNIPQTVTVSAIDDGAVEGPHSRVISATASGDAAYAGILIDTVLANITDNDYLGVTPSKTTVTLAEGGATDNYTVVLGSQPLFNVFVTLAPGGQLTLSQTILTFTSVSWSTAQTVIVTAVDDGLVEATTHSGTITATVSSADVSYNFPLVTVADISAAITDNDEIRIDVNKSAATVAENGATDTYLVVLRSQPAANVFITFAPGAQLNLSQTTLTFTTVSWNAPQTVTITAVDDGAFEGIQTSLLTGTVSGDATYSLLTVPSITVTIIDDDIPGVTSSKFNVGVTEGLVVTDTYTIVLNTLPAATVTVNLNPGTQTTLSQSSLTFTTGNWNIAQTVAVTAADDSIAEGLHTATISGSAVSSDPDYNIASLSLVTATITDDDTPGVSNSKAALNVTEGGVLDTYTIRLTSQPTANVIVTLNPGTQVSLSQTLVTFTPANWSTFQTITATAVNDNANEASQVVNITATASSADSTYQGPPLFIASVAVTITDNDPANVLPSKFGVTLTEGTVASDSFTVVLASQPTASVLVTLNGNGQANVTPSVLTFTSANWNTPRLVTVTAVNDPIDEASPHTGSITFTTSSSDGAYNGLGVAAVTANITDDDSAASTTANHSGTGTAVTEGGATDTFSVVLSSQPTANVLITLNPGVQLLTSAAVLTFTSANWLNAQTITVSAMNDFVSEGSHTGTITFTFTSGDSIYNGFALAPLTASITDNDPGGITNSKSTLSLTEATATDSYLMVLGTQPTANVLVTLNTGAQLTAIPPLTFTSGNWNVPQTVLVSAVDDLVPELPTTVTLSATVTSTDLTYNGFALANVTVNITDNDPFPGGSIVQTGGTVVTEGGTTDVYGLALTTVPTANVIVSIVPDGQVTVSTNSLTFTPATWNTPQFVTVTAFDDNVAEGSPHFGTITNTAASGDPNYNGIDLGSVTASITDNDYAAVGLSGADRIVVYPSSDGTRILVSVNAKITALPLSVQRVVVDAGAGNDTIEVIGAPIPVDIISGGGIDKLFITGRSMVNNFNLDSTFATLNGVMVTFDAVESLIINGNIYDDNFTVTTIPAMPTEIKGDFGSDTIFAPNTNNDWFIQGTKTGTLNTLLFSTMERLFGGPLDDTFAYKAGTVFSGPINGGGGTNVLDYSRYTTPLTINLLTGKGTGFTSIAGIAQIVAGSSKADKLYAANLANSWDISALNTGQVTAPASLITSGLLDFSGFETLFGGTSTDDFTFQEAAGVTGTIDAGTGLDSFDFSNYSSTDLTVNLHTNKAFGTSGAATLVSFGFLGVDTLYGGSGSSDKLIGANILSLWTLSGSDNGSVKEGAITFNYTAMENLVGGSAVDRFTATGTWSGTLDGGAGTDSLLGDVGDHSWDFTGLNRGDFDGQAFVNIESHVGNSGADTFVFRLGASVKGTITGGGNNDVLDYSAFTAAISVNLASGLASATTGIAQIEQVIGGTNLADAITGPNLDVTWNLGGPGSGTITGLASPTYTFAGFENLGGGSRNDIFALAMLGTWTGLLNGSSGSDFLIAYSGMVNVYNPVGSSTGTLNGNKFTSIETRR